MNTEKFSDSKPVAALAATTLETGTLTAQGETIDTRFFQSFTVALDIDVTTDGQIDSIKFEESDDGSTWADCDDSENLYYPDAFPIDADQVVHVGCVSKKRYIRLDIISSGFTTGNIAIAKAVGLLQDAMTKPMVKESSVLADADVRSPGDEADTETTAPKRLP